MLIYMYMSTPFDQGFFVGGGALLPPPPPPPPSSLLASLCFHASSLALAFSKLRCRLRFFSSRKHCRGASSKVSRRDQACAHFIAVPLKLHTVHGRAMREQPLRERRQ